MAGSVEVSGDEARLRVCHANFRDHTHAELCPSKSLAETLGQKKQKW